MADTAFLPKKLNRLFNKDQSPERMRIRRFRRNVLDRLILALADQQLVTGFSLMLTGWIVYPHDLGSAHFALIVYLSCLSSSSHLAAIVTLRKYFEDNQTLALFRITIISLFAVLLSLSISLTSAFGPFYFVFYFVTNLTAIGPLANSIGLLRNFISIMPILWTFWTGIWQIVPALRARFQTWLKCVIWPRVKRAGLGRCWSWTQTGMSERKSQKLRRTFWSVLTYVGSLSPMTVFLFQVAFAMISVSMALAQKFDPGSEDGDECSLNSPEENEMGYGQVLAILLLILPAIATFEAYKGMSIHGYWILASADHSAEEERKVRIEEAKEGLLPLLAIGYKVALSSDELASHPELNFTHEQVRALRNIMDGQSTRAQDFCPPSRQDTEQRVGEQGESTTSSTTVNAQGFEEGSGTTTRRGTWDAHD
jgi:hypothetical protein